MGLLENMGLTERPQAARTAERPSAARPDPLRTSDISLVSHTHGRERREERGIAKRELQEAVRHGRREIANPGRRGEKRWRYTHKGVTYITDETSRHEITSWRLDEAGPDAPIAPPDSVYGTHVVVVVDSSGSMRKPDVPGHPTRTAAVYESINRDLVRPQLDAARASGAMLGSVRATVIEMSDVATVLFQRVAIDEWLFQRLDERKRKRASSHGNYLPALDRVLEVLVGDVLTQTQLFLLFLSDGAPSDHNELACRHGIQVWQPGHGTFKGKPALRTCPDTHNCRKAIQAHVRSECVKKVQKLGDLFGRDRVFIATVGFGPASESYEVLEEMARAMPRSSFQKLGLTAGGLRTAFSSLSSTLTSMRTESAGDGAKRDLRKHDVERPLDDLEYDVYVGAKFLKKERWELTTQSWESIALTGKATGVAHANEYFSSGAERVAYHALK